MNIEKLKEQLIDDEGIEYKMYLDSKGKATMGIGHLVTRKDPEFHHIKDMATKTITISKERVSDLFSRDIEICLEDCRECFPNFIFMIEELQLIIANMMFNLGRQNFLGFKKFIKAIEQEDHKKAAEEMIDSKWYRIDVPKRADRLVKRMKAINSCQLDTLKEDYIIEALSTNW